MKKILILSNTACSNTESNGRIHALHYLKYLKNDCLFNFYIGGCPDIENVTYVHFSYKQAIKSKILFFKKQKLKIFKGKEIKEIRNVKNKKNQCPLLHLLRNFCFKKNKVILNELSKLIKAKGIGALVIWGSNAPFLYEYGWKLAIKNNIELITFTGEDYPLKKYNYISRRYSISFKMFQKQLNKQAFRAYKKAVANIFATTDLLLAYETSFNISGSFVVPFSSALKSKKYKTAKIRSILYAGNLYEDRAESLIEIASHIKDHKDVSIKVFGKASEKVSKKLNSICNITYYGVISYNDLKKEMQQANLLLHIEGFSDYYKKDCKFAFSTKISDYFMLNKPFFLYGPKEISGIKFAYKVNENFVATSKDELNKLDAILDGDTKYNVDYSLINEKFDAEKNSLRIFDIIENIN